MSERDDLATVLHEVPDYRGWSPTWSVAEHLADAILAAGWVPERGGMRTVEAWKQWSDEHAPEEMTRLSALAQSNGKRPREAEAERDALAATVQRVRALCKPKRCHQCDGTGQQEAGERHAAPRLVQSAPTTETCHLCNGAGSVEPLAVTVDDLRAALAAPSDPATDTGGEG